jgi:creatinine amidohydrolase
MRNIYTVILVGILLSCSHKEKVLYEELTPKEFSSRLAHCPVAYLPLGTLEWHGVHLPLGSDGLQSQEFFKRLAYKAGGIVLPMIFIGPDLYSSSNDSTPNGMKYYGMDHNAIKLTNGKFERQQLAGSAYWVPDSIFNGVLDAIMYQLSRAGFKIVIAHGHTPSIWRVDGHAEEYMRKYNLKVMSCWGDDTRDLCLMCDHAAANETSIMMAVRPDLVQMENLPKDTAVWPQAIAGKDPRIHASSKFGNEIIDFEIKKMVSRIKSELQKMK